ncbi:SCO7613 C-terminal domain-containing membrane protein [Streptomyces sp. HPF1205]|uniref:SCO7613 C-terminal domain-containing membrane protein n=1 Tax=Streptomyces sp. HPF1205 TaxID=2873262 RepID=UPI001CEC254C|nr:hypothetical protein [Streptomyces sp. HPF1205]
MDVRLPYCPDCGAPLVAPPGTPGEARGPAGSAPPGSARPGSARPGSARPGSAPSECPRCRLPLTGPDAAEFLALVAELAELDARRGVLIDRRTTLLYALRSRRSSASAAAPASGGSPHGYGAPAGRPATWGAAGPRPGGAAPGARPFVPRPDASAPSVQTVLLVLGGLLITVAGLVFTLVNWGRLGIGGRAAVLAVLTALALAVPVPLRRRGLTATAETAAAVGFALVLLDSYAARAAGLAGLQRADAAAYWAAATALTGLAAGAYAWRTRSAALAFGSLALLQFTVPLTTAALGAAPAGRASAAIALAALDVAAALAAAPFARRAGRGPALGFTALSLAALWSWTGGALACRLAFTADGCAPALRACVPLAALALLGAATASRGRAFPAPARLTAAVAAGLALTATAAAAPHPALPAAWTPLALAVPAALLTALTPAAASRRSDASPGGADPLRTGLAASGALVVAGAFLAVVPAAARALGEPFLRSLPGAEHAGFPGGRQVTGVVPCVLLLAAAVAAFAAVRLRLTAAACGAAVVAVAGVALAPLAAGAPYSAVLAVASLPGLAAAAALRRPARDAVRAAQWSVLLAAAAVALTWSLPEDAAALTVWAGAAVVAAALAGTAPLAAAFAVAALAVEAGRAAVAAGLPLHQAAFAVLGVAVASVPAAALLKGTSAEGAATARGLAVETAGYAVGAVALLMAAGDARALSTAMAVAGAAALGASLRADRRRAALPTATALLAAASWIRLALAGVEAPEPYTVPIGAVALVLGLLRRRRDPAAGSWTAYGPGLALSLLPALAAAWADTGWPRPLLLGLAALAVTLVGARRRLRAPLLLGGAVLLGDALHELAPALTRTLALLPRWVLPAAAGLLLVVVGATYERRLADGRRLREALRRMD